MNVVRQENLLLLKFNRLERRLLLTCLENIHSLYQVHPADLDPSTQAVWYSTRGCEAAGLNPSETKDWVDHLFQFKSDNLHLIEAWLHALKHPPHVPTLALSLEQAPTFLTVINDHRLLLAARHGFGESNLGLPPWDAIQRIAPNELPSLLEVELLGHLMELVLRALPNSGADWRLDCPDVGPL